MKAVYINLDAAGGRRADIERQFTAVAQPNWSLARFPALTADQMADRPGRISLAAKACFDSHRRALAAHLSDDAPLFIMEDDVALSRMTLPVVDALLNANDDWDILFTEVALFDPAVMVEFARQYDGMRQAGRFITAKLKGVHFAGSTAYVVRGASKAKVSSILASATSLDLPLDIYLRQRCDAGDLKCSVCFPFVTSLTSASEASQISPGEQSLHLHVIAAFRRLMFVDRKVGQALGSVAAIEAQLDEPSRLVGVLLGAMAKPM